ncbi:hypothetical protein L7F22_066292 [Adiantum nelumboides]|nr:hypothetical protein [Adiantum nelumboides]
MVTCANNASYPVQGVGKIVLTAANGSSFTLVDALYVPGIKKNLLSVSALARLGLVVKFVDDRCTVHDLRFGDEIFASGILCRGLYKLTLYDKCGQNFANAVVDTKAISDAKLWHARFGHLNFASLLRLQKSVMVASLPPLEAPVKHVCEGCILGKMQRSKFPQDGSVRATCRLQLVHSDVCGPMQTPSLGNYLYFVTFIDDYFRHAWHEADQQHHWSLIHNDRISKLKEKLKDCENEFKKGKEELSKKQQVLDAQSHSLAIASAQLAKKQVEQLGQQQSDFVRTHNLQLANLNSELQQRRRSFFRQLCKIFPLKFTSPSSVGGNVSTTQLWTICGAPLPIRDDPHSVSKQELGSSLGYLLQLVHLAARYLCAPLLHEGRLRGSFSSIWQRSLYWDASCSKSGEYPLFILASGSSSSDEHSFSDKGTSIMGFSTIESIAEERPEDGCDNSSRYGNSSVQNLEMHTAVQKAIKLLKRSVVCVTSYGFNELLPASPSNMTTFQAFAELMNLLSSKEVRLRSSQHLVSSLADSALSTVSTMDVRREGKECREFQVVTGGPSHINSSFCYIGRDLDHAEDKDVESVFDEWHVVEPITLPPPPSDSEDVEHWTRAMFVDAKK